MIISLPWELFSLIKYSSKQSRKCLKMIKCFLLDKKYDQFLLVISQNKNIIIVSYILNYLIRMVLMMKELKIVLYWLTDIALMQYFIL